MIYVNVNDESKTQVIVNLEEIEACDECLEECQEVIDSLVSKFDIKRDSIDEPQDYYYTINCSSEEMAIEIEEYVSDIFDDIEEKFSFDCSL